MKDTGCRRAHLRFGSDGHARIMCTVISQDKNRGEGGLEGVDKAGREATGGFIGGTCQSNGFPPSIFATLPPPCSRFYSSRNFVGCSSRLAVCFYSELPLALVCQLSPKNKVIKGNIII